MPSVLLPPSDWHVSKSFYVIHDPSGDSHHPTSPKGIGLIRLDTSLKSEKWYLAITSVRQRNPIRRIHESTRFPNAILDRQKNYFLDEVNTIFYNCHLRERNLSRASWKCVYSTLRLIEYVRIFVVLKLATRQMWVVAIRCRNYFCTRTNR